MNLAKTRGLALADWFDPPKIWIRLDNYFQYTGWVWIRFFQLKLIFFLNIKLYYVIYIFSFLLKLYKFIFIFILLLS